MYLHSNHGIKSYADATLDEFLNFKNALHLIDDANWPPNHKTY